MPCWGSLTHRFPSNETHFTHSARPSQDPDLFVEPEIEAVRPFMRLKRARVTKPEQ